MTFTENMERIQQIVKMLDSGNLTLEESIELFKEGVELVKSCKNFLEKSEQIIKILSEDMDDNLISSSEAEEVGSNE
ncbi:exodeoxyribonuclease VII small subunit [Thermovirga sp.]|uniref:exodeoxyribonuclease VII small subunit n=1 Tax=Thermovirga sp. TaxID=2699834 RepID=UPI0025CDA114|nr:exodeoxyribonuclease VII small subunit [Thermovirga sp.]MBO8153135.1 exodeoxyribonuclease VII small subunit [Thermovirga sp.]MCD6183046.1 exodeoxyribonuclease VII small subunit [Thermovirga sp.]